MISAITSTNYTTWAERHKVATRSLISGDMVTILLRQTMRLKALAA